MNRPDTDDRIRPGFLVLALCLVALAILSFLLMRTKPPQPAVAVENTAAVEPAPKPEPAPAPVPVAAAPRVPPAPSSALENLWGIQVSSVGLAMEGNALDVRYTVVDPEKAMLLAQGVGSPCLVEQATGTRITMPTPPPTGAGSARTRARMERQGGSFPPSPNRLALGHTNSILLPNPGRIVRSGSKVAFGIGDTYAGDLTVR